MSSRSVLWYKPKQQHNNNSNNNNNSLSQMSAGNFTAIITRSLGYSSGHKATPSGQRVPVKMRVEAASGLSSSASSAQVAKWRLFYSGKKSWKLGIRKTLEYKGWGDYGLFHRIELRKAKWIKEKEGKRREEERSERNKMQEMKEKRKRGERERGRKESGEEKKRDYILSVLMGVGRLLWAHKMMGSLWES